MGIGVPECKIIEKILKKNLGNHCQNPQLSREEDEGTHGIMFLMTPSTVQVVQLGRYLIKIRAIRAEMKIR